MSRLIQTDHGQQSLVLDQKTERLIQYAMDYLQTSNVTSATLKKQARDLVDFMLDPDNRDQPTLFERYHNIDKCPGCQGAGRIKNSPDNRDDEVRYETCDKCVGHGNLYYIIVKKGYAPTEQIRRQMAK